EDKELFDFMDMIDLLPPGLYEAVIMEAPDQAEKPEPVSGRYLFSLEARTLGDIRALGGNDAADDLRFATVRAVSEANLGLYRTFLGPTVRNSVTEQSAELMRHLHPSRMRFEMFADKNPLMSPVAQWADAIRRNRRPVAPDNPLQAMERTASDWIVGCLDAFTEARDAACEGIFMATYDQPWLQALAGLRADGAQTRQHVERELAREAGIQRTRAELNDRIDQGSAIEAALRAVIYLQQPERKLDGRGFTILKEINLELPPEMRVSFTVFKEKLKEQYLIMMLDEERAVTAIPKLLPSSGAERDALMRAIRRILAVGGSPSDEARRREARAEALFGETKAISARPSDQLQISAA